MELEANEDLQGTPAGASSEQSEDWEARYKGQLKAYQKLQKEHEATKTSLEGARITAQNYQQQINALESERGSKAAEYESKIAELSTTVKQYETAKSNAEKQVAELTGKIEQNNKDAKVRKVLAKPEYQALLPFYEAGIMPGIVDLEDTELTARLDTAKGLLGQSNLNTFMENIRGIVPPVGGAPQSSGTAFDSMTTEKLSEWLSSPANISSAQYDAVQTIYFDKLKAT